MVKKNTFTRKQQPGISQKIKWHCRLIDWNKSSRNYERFLCDFRSFASFSILHIFDLPHEKESLKAMLYDREDNQEVW